MKDLQEIFDSYKKTQLGSEKRIEALHSLCRSPEVDAVSYKLVASSEMNDGSSVVEFNLDRNFGDILTDFNVYVPDMIPFQAFYEIVGQGKTSLYKDTLIPIVCAMYVPIRIKIVLDKIPNKVELSHKAYLIQSEKRNKLMFDDLVVDKRVRYRDGMATLGKWTSTQN